MLFEIKDTITSPFLLRQIILEHTRQNVSEATIDLIIEHKVKRVREFWKGNSLRAVLILMNFYGKKILESYVMYDIPMTYRLHSIREFVDGEGEVEMLLPTNSKLDKLLTASGFLKEVRGSTSVFEVGR